MVDVVVRLHDPTDPTTERTAPPSSAHVQLDDDLRPPIQPSSGDEFRQHDGVVTMMLMLYWRRASPKLRYGMTEVDYGGGEHRTRLKINDQLVSQGGPPHPYIKELGGRPAALGAPRRGGESSS